MIITRQAKRKSKQMLAACMVSGRLAEDRVREEARHLIAAGSRKSRPILSHFLRLVRLEIDQHTARIESAALLPADLRAAIRSDLTRIYGSGLVTDFSERSSLIGGVRIQVGSDVFDGSVLGRLAALENRF
jgi:F-type H+-transporting ATPase subunit delta